MKSLLVQDQIKSEVRMITSELKEKYEDVILSPCKNGVVDVVAGDYVFSRFHGRDIFVEEKRVSISSRKLEELVGEYSKVWGVNLHAFPA